MFLATLALLLSPLGDTPADDAARLVAALGSPRFAERQEADQALRDLGPRAVEVLQAARKADDPEVRLRAEGALQAIERAEMLGPSLVVLDDPDEPVARAVRDVASQTGFALRTTPGLADGRRVGPLDGARGRPIPFWEAIERLGLDAEAAEPDPMAGPFGRTGPPTLRVFEVAGLPRPAWHEGPFRLAVREVGLGFDEADLIAPPPRPGFRVRAIRPAPRPTHLELGLELLAEPRLRLRPECRVEITEAVGEGGQVLAVASAEAMGWELVAGRPMDRNLAGSSLPIGVDLRLPDGPVRTLSRLAGTLKFDVLAPRLDPVEIPLPRPGDDPPGALEVEALRLIVHGMIRQPGGAWAVDMTVQPDDLDGLFAGRPGMGFGRRRFATLLDGLLQGVEFADGAGRPIQPSDMRIVGPAPGGFRLLVSLPPSDAGRPPARLRYRDLIRETVEVKFSLENISLPER